MKDQGEGTQPLGKLLHLRLSAEEPETPLTPEPNVSPILALVAFVGFLVIVAGLLTWFLK